MRHRGALLVGLLAVLPVACAGGPEVQTVSRADGPRGSSPAPAGLVQMDVALLERPVGDTYINRALWALTDEQVIPLEHRAVLEENGFRVGQVVGLPPAELQALLLSPRCCANPRRRLLAPGYSASVVLSSNIPECRFQVRKEEEPQKVVLQQAQCALVVVATPTSDGRVQLHFTPRVEHGELLREMEPADDRSGWTLEVKRQTETYPAMGWDVTVAPNEYLVIGAWFDEPATLGYQAFVDTQGPSPVQRLLVIRTGRSGGGIDAEIADLPPEDPSLAGRPPPLALQAAWSAVRASGP
jgi:hypothetical protein